MVETSNRAKGRWVAAATVGIVTFTWMWAVGPNGASLMLAAGILIGGPYALIAGTLLGALAGRLVHHRELVLVGLALITALVLDGLPWLCFTGESATQDPMILTLLVLSLVPTIASGLWLERWTRPAPAVTPAIARQTR